MARLGNSQEALADYRKALELDPNCASAHFNLAVTLVQDGDFAEAETHYRQALSGKPTAETHNGLGYVLEQQGQEDESIAEFRKAIDIDPKFTPAYNNLASALEEQGKLADAEEYYRRSLELRPNAAVYNAHGAVLRRLGKTDEAADQFSKATALGAAQ